MRKMKRAKLWAGVVLAGFIGVTGPFAVFGGMNWAEAIASTPETPEIRSITFDKMEVTPGNNLKVNMSLSGSTDLSYALIGVRGINDGYQKAFFTINKGNLEAVFDIDDTWKNDDYYIAYISLYDIDGRCISFTDGKVEFLRNDAYDLLENYKKMKFSVKGSKEESVKVVSTSFSKKNVSPGDELEMTVKLSKPVKLSGNTSTELQIKDSFFVMKTDWNKVVLSQSDEKTLKGTITIDNRWYNATYTAFSFRGFDTDDNLKEDTFTLTNSKEDSSGPEVKNISFDKKQAQPGDIVNVKVTASDPSGLLDKGEISILNENFFRLSTELKKTGTDTYEGSFKIRNNLENGNYEPAGLVVKDTLGNSSGLNYSDKYDGFTIVNSSGVKDANVVKSISFDKKIVTYGESVTVSAELIDGINAESVSVDIWEVLDGPGGGIYNPTETVSLKQQDDGKWTGTVTIDNTEKEKGFTEDRGILWTEDRYYEARDIRIFTNDAYYVGRTANNVQFLLGFKDRLDHVAQNVTLDKKLLVLDKGKTGRLKAAVTPAEAEDKTITWSSSNTNVATVDASGNIKAINHGTAKITAKTSNGKTATCEVRVNFIDVTNPKDWYYKAVYWAAEKGITTGTDGKFFHADNCTREQAITFLWRMAGKPNPKSMTSKFSDVKDSKRYSYKAIMWGSENGIITGTNGKFYPTDTCTREQIVTMLWRQAGQPAPKNMNSKFKDVKDSKRYSYKAIMWAQENGITTGTNGLFSPTGLCKRREIVTFIYRYKN